MIDNELWTKLCFAPIPDGGPGLVPRCQLPWGHTGSHDAVVQEQDDRSDPRDVEIKRLQAEIFRASQDKLVSGSFLQAEVLFWRRRYESLAFAIDTLVGEQFKTRHQIPPEPPVGTKFVQPQGGTWTRRDDGWHCPGEGCNNCPATWDEVETYVRDATRHLPGVMASHG